MEEIVSLLSSNHDIVEAREPGSRKWSLATLTEGDIYTLKEATVKFPSREVKAAAI
jgi:hypothetical protein